MRFTDNKSEITAKALKSTLKEASRAAVNENFALGIPVTVIKNRRLIKIFPDGKEIVLKSIETPVIKVKTKRIILE